MRNDIKVSVIITTYKRADMLKRAIDSVLNQSYENIEVLVIDDNDPDTIYRSQTQDIINSYINNNKVKYIKHKKNMNGAVARNTGIKASEGKVICFLDDDDWYKEDKIEKQLKYLLENRQFKAVYCGWNRDNKVVIPKNEGNLIFKILSGEGLIYTNTIMIWKSAILEFDGWDEELKRNQEAGFLLRYFSKGYHIGVVKESLVEFDITDRSNVLNAEKNEEQFEFLLKKYIYLIENIEGNIRKMKRKVYSYRYRGVFLTYIKERKFKGAFKVYLKMLKYIPFTYNKDLLKYTYYKMLRKDLYRI